MSYLDVISQLRKARLTRRLNQDVIAQKLGISQSMLSRYEKGTAEVPSSTLIRWCELVGLTVLLTQEAA